MGRRDKAVRVSSDRSRAPGCVRGDAAATARAAADAGRGDLFSQGMTSLLEHSDEAWTGSRSGRELSHFWALSMLGLFASWAISLILGFGVLEWAQEPAVKNAVRSSLFDQFYMSGVTFFTLQRRDCCANTPRP
jgi:hypothetical protein